MECLTDDLLLVEYLKDSSIIAITMLTLDFGGVRSVHVQMSSNSTAHVVSMCKNSPDRGFIIGLGEHCVMSKDYASTFVSRMI